MPMPSRFLSQLEPGDLVLSGRRDLISEITQLVTRSRFGHAMVVLQGNRLVQATDIALTPEETDEGVFVVTYSEFLDKTRQLCDIKVLRPRLLDRVSLSKTANYLIDHSPTYPTVGAVVMGFWCAAAGVVSRLPPNTRTRVVRLQFRLAADGPTRMHCAELVLRLYTSAGTTIDFTSPTLSDVINYSLSLRPELLELRLQRRRATPGQWPPKRSAAARHAVGQLVQTLSGRFDPSIARDHAGLVMPGDFERSPSFTPVFDISRRRGGWHEYLAA